MTPGADRGWSFQPARAAHSADLAPRLRPADLGEIAALRGSAAPADVLREGIERSSQAWAAIRHGRVQVLFGVVPVALLGGVGAPWMLASDEIERDARHFVWCSRQIVPMLATGYSVLENWVWAEHAKAVKWLGRLGFELGEPMPIGQNGAMFRRFRMECHV